MASSSRPNPNPTPKRPRPRRGNYNCGRCGLPKKGHVCSLNPGADVTTITTNPSSSSSKSRRALSFPDDAAVTSRSSCPPSPAPDDEIENMEMDDEEGEDEMAEEAEDEFVNVGEGRWVPVSGMMEILRRLPPREVMAAAAVSRGWRECAARVWRDAEEMRIRVVRGERIGYFASALHRCAGLARLLLRMER